MKLTVHTFVSLDGVMQGPGGPEEDTSGGFERGGWMVPFGDAEFGAIVDDWFSRTGELLLGRTTYDIFAAYWPQVTDPAERVAAVLNTAPKHVVSNSLTDPTWVGTTVISGTQDEVVAAIRALKDRRATTRDDCVRRVRWRRAPTRSATAGTHRSPDPPVRWRLRTRY